MNATTTSGPATSPSPPEFLTELLERSDGIVELTSPIATAPAVERRANALMRNAPNILSEAKEAGVEIEFLGMHPLFDEARFYEGSHGSNGWILGPAGDHEQFLMPRSEARRLDILEKGGLWFPHLYIAHEVPPDETEHLVVLPGSDHVKLDTAEAMDIVGPAPPPAEVVGRGEILGQKAAAVIRGAGRVVVFAGAIAAAPVLLAGAALSAAATTDPIVVGAIPAGPARPGVPAAWYAIARWDW